MSVLVIAEHDHAQLKGTTLNTVTAALQCGGEVHLLLAGHNAGEAARQAAQITGVAKVLHADAPQLGEQLAENIAAQVLAMV
jgi:electron transfer flavoprotein alpha subunit